MQSGDGKILKVAVKFRQKSQSRDSIKNCSLFKKKLQSFFKIYHHIREFCVTFRILQLYFESCSQVISDFEKIAVTFGKLQSRDCRFRNLIAK